MEFAIDLSLNNTGIVQFENGVIQNMYLLRNDQKYPKKMLKTAILADKIEKIIKFLDENCYLCADVVYLERPTGSIDASGLINYSVEVAMYAYLRSKGLNVVWVSVSDAKIALTGNKNAEKDEMLRAAVYNYPGAPWIKDRKGNVYKYNHHLADAIGIYLAGSKKN